MSTDLDVRYVANLARIELTDSEAGQFQSQLSKILDHVEQLNQVDLSGVEPTAHANPVYNVFREDAPGASLPKEEALKNAPHSANGLIMITKVIE